VEPDLVIFGALHRDLVATLLQPHQEATSNPVTFALSSGGVGANTARAAIRSQFVQTLRLVSPAGATGLAPDVATSGFEGIDICPVPVPGAQAGRYVAIVDTDGEVISGYSDTSACDAADAVSLLNECPASARSMVVDANLSTKTLETLLSSLPIARYALAVSPVKARKLITLAQLVDTLFCNRLEAASITGLSGDTPLNTLSDALGTCGFTTHVLTDGGADLLVLEDGTRTPVTVEGPQLTGSGNANGAGDALAGATIAACHAGQSLTSAVSSAGLAAARQIMTQA